MVCPIPTAGTAGESADDSEREVLAAERGVGSGPEWEV